MKIVFLKLFGLCNISESVFPLISGYAFLN